MLYRTILIAVLLGFVFACAAMAQEAPKQITFGEKRDIDPAVSPDGTHLVFSSNRTGAFNLFLANLNEDKMGFTQLTQGKKDDRYPTWAGDNKIIFSSKRTGNGDLYETAIDGSSGFVQLTTSEQRDECPTYNAKKSAIAYSTGKSKLNIVLITRSDPRTPITLGEGDEPKFSKDGTKIVFVSRRTKNNDIWMMNADGSKQMQLTTNPKDDINPGYSPDGSKIIFASDRAGNYDIWMMNVDGTNQRQLTTDPQDDTKPCWSPGGYIYFTHKVSETQANIYRIKAP